MKKKFIYGITIVATISLLTGCGRAKLKNGEELVAKVDGYKVSAEDLYKELADKYGVETLINMIDHELLDAKYKTDDNEKAQIESQISRMKESYGVSSDEDFLAIVKQLYKVNDLDEFRVLLGLDYKRDLAIQDYVAEDVVTEDEVKEYYENKVIGDVKASHILIKPKTSDSASEEEKEKAENEALNKAKEIIKKLDNGEKFSALAKKYSDDKATASKGGDLGYFNKDDNYEENFVTAAAGLEKGKYTVEPVKTKYGYEIILKVDEKDKKSQEDLEKEIRATLAQEKISSDTSTTAYYKRLRDFRESKGLKFSDSKLEKLYKKYIDSLINENTEN